jgi:hypothetical protein
MKVVVVPVVARDSLGRDISKIPTGSSIPPDVRARVDAFHAEQRRAQAQLPPGSPPVRMTETPDGVWEAIPAPKPAEAAPALAAPPEQMTRTPPPPSPRPMQVPLEEPYRRPGRPAKANRDLIETEMVRRAGTGESKSTMKREAICLSKWLE